MRWYFAYSKPSSLVIKDLKYYWSASANFRITAYYVTEHTCQVRSMTLSKLAKYAQLCTCRVRSVSLSVLDEYLCSNNLKPLSKMTAPLCIELNHLNYHASPYFAIYLTISHIHAIIYTLSLSYVAIACPFLLSLIHVINYLCVSII